MMESMSTIAKSNRCACEGVSYLTLFSIASRSASHTMTGVSGE